MLFFTMYLKDSLIFVLIGFLACRENQACTREGGNIQNSGRTTESGGSKTS